MKEMIGKWNNEFRKVNLIKEIKLRLRLKASFYDNLCFMFYDLHNIKQNKTILFLWLSGELHMFF